MLNPNVRSLYTAALTPPSEMIFAEAIATTFSMDPSVLLTVPAHLALLTTPRESQLTDGIVILESLRRLTDHITVYAQRGRIVVPRVAHQLYGLLESMVVEVQAPRGGVFHPKCWLIRFTDPHGNDPLLRFMVLSRNLTTDRSWDLALQLEGRPGTVPDPNNEPLRDLLLALPTLAYVPVNDEREEQSRRLADEVHRTVWEMPSGMTSVRFHLLGLTERGWTPPSSERLAIISPFCGDEALVKLTLTTQYADALIARPDSLKELHPATRAKFERCLVLDDAASTEDGEAQDDRASWDTTGLHAKAYICECGDQSHIIMGSANATNAAVLARHNVEMLAELVGPRGIVGGIDELLGADGFGEVLVEMRVPEDALAIDLERQAAESALEDARQALVTSDLRVCFDELPGDTRWGMRLEGKLLSMPGITSFSAWPITVTSNHAVSLMGFATQSSVSLGEFAAGSLTRLIAFELTTAYNDLFARFVLCLPGDIVPAAREVAIMQTVIGNRNGFLRYLLLLLGELGAAIPYGLEDCATASGMPWTWGRKSIEAMPLLEELVRAYSRNPERLHDVGRIVRKLTENGHDGTIIPPDFLALWDVFEAALEEHHGI